MMHKTSLVVTNKTNSLSKYRIIIIARQTMNGQGSAVYVSSAVVFARSWSWRYRAQTEGYTDGDTVQDEGVKREQCLFLEYFTRKNVASDLNVLPKRLINCTRACEAQERTRQETSDEKSRIDDIWNCPLRSILSCSSTSSVCRWSGAVIILTPCWITTVVSGRFSSVVMSSPCARHPWGRRPWNSWRCRVMALHISFLT